MGFKFKIVVRNNKCFDLKSCKRKTLNRSLRTMLEKIKKLQKESTSLFTFKTLKSKAESALLQ